MLNSIKPASGKLLISEPFMADPNFKRSVVYLTEYNENGAVGFVLNQKTDLILSDLVDEVGVAEYPIFIGGPVGNDSLHYIHTLGEQIEGAMRVQDDVFWGGNFEAIKVLIRNGEVSPDQIKFFIGYSGWGDGQLDDELNDNAWLVANSKSHFVFGEFDKQLWSQVVKSLGDKYAMLANFPENPRLN